MASTQWASQVHYYLQRVIHELLTRKMAKMRRIVAAIVAKILRDFKVNTKVVYLGAGRAKKNDPTSRYVQIVAANS